MDSFKRRKANDTIKLITAGQSRTASTTEDTHAVAQSANISIGRLAKAVLLGKEHDPATIAGPDARNSIRKEALEVVRAGGTGAIEGQGDRRGLLVGVGRAVSLLASVFGLGGESHVQACDEVLRGCRVVAGRGEAGREFAQGVVGAEISADSGEAGLLGVGCQLMGACNEKGWRRTHEARRDALLRGDRVEDGEAREKELECHC
jgi:hypothetical protein